MQYQIGKNFIFAAGNEEIGEMHKSSKKVQMFLGQNHSLKNTHIFNKIVVYHSYIMESYG